MNAADQSWTSTAPDALDLTGLKRTAAITEVLRRSGSDPMSINDIIVALEAGGRTGDSYQVVAATLQSLLNFDRVARVGRGLYSAA